MKSLPLLAPLIVSMLSGCGSVVFRQGYDGPPRPLDQVALVYPDWIGSLNKTGRWLAIQDVDGRPVDPGAGHMVSVTPGAHGVRVVYTRTVPDGPQWVKVYTWRSIVPIDVRAGEVYSLCISGDTATLRAAGPLKAFGEPSGDPWQQFLLKPCASTQ